MRDPRLPLALLSVLMLGACGDPPAMDNGGGGGSGAGSNAIEGEGGTTDVGELVAGVGYNPKYDPLVNTASMVEPPPADNAGVAMDEVFVATLDGNPATINPIFSSSTYESRINSLIFDGPFTFNAKMEWMINDAMVESLDISDDQRVWTLKLKPGLKWHDGHPFTAHDIAFSWKEILDERVPCPAQKAGTDEIELCEAVDDLTVRYVHKDPQPTSKWNAFFSIIPKHLYEKGKDEDPTLKQSPYYSQLNRNPVGSGPYKLVEWKENDKIVLERWDDFHGPQYRFKRIVFRIIPDTNIQLLTFESGETDETRLSSKQFADETVTSKKFKEVGLKAFGTQWSFSYIVWNQSGSNPFFGDKRVRRAMTHATNIPLMLETISYNLCTPCYGMFHPDAWMASQNIKLLDYDLEKASALLNEAGWTLDPETGYRTKNGTKFSFTLLYSQGSSSAEQLAAILQQDLKSIGVEMKTQVMEWAAFSEKTRKHDFQAATAGWGTGVDPDTNWNIWHSEAYEKGRNYGGFKSDRVDELFVKARNEFDTEKRAEYYREIHEIVYDEQPYTFLWNVPVLWAFNKRTRGVTFSPRGVWGFDPSISAWWVKEGQQMRAMK